MDTGLFPHLAIVNNAASYEHLCTPNAFRQCWISIHFHKNDDVVCPITTAKIEFPIKIEALRDHGKKTNSGIL